MYHEESRKYTWVCSECREACGAALKAPVTGGTIKRGGTLRVRACEISSSYWPRTTPVSYKIPSRYFVVSTKYQLDDLKFMYQRGMSEVRTGLQRVSRGLGHRFASTGYRWDHHGERYAASRGV